MGPLCAPWPAPSCSPSHEPERFPHGSLSVHSCAVACVITYPMTSYCQLSLFYDTRLCSFVGEFGKKNFFWGGDFPPRDEQARINTAGTCLWLCANAGYHQISVVGKFEDSITRKVTQYRSATDGRTEFLYQYRSSASLCWRAIKMPSCYTVSLTLIARKWLGSAPTFYPIFGFFGTLPFDFLKYSLATNLHVMWCAIVLK